MQKSLRSKTLSHWQQNHASVLRSGCDILFTVIENFVIHVDFPKVSQISQDNIEQTSSITKKKVKKI